MSDSDLDSSCTTHVAFAPATSVGAALRAFVAWHRRKRAEKDLLALSDDQLMDIGVHPWTVRNGPRLAVDVFFTNSLMGMW